MKTLKLFITLSLALFLSGGLMAQLTITVTDHVEGNLKTEIGDQLILQGKTWLNDSTNITSLTISGVNLNSTDATAIKSCTNLVTLDVSGVAFASNMTPSITSNSSGMCNGLQKLETVVLPNTLRIIGTYAFYSCPELKNINLNDDITEIRQNAFMLCKKLNMTSLPANLLTIGSSSFAQSNVTLTELPETVKTIAGSAFSKCSNVTISELPSGLTRLDTRAFEFTPVTISKLPSGLKLNDKPITTIPERVFDRTSIVNFTIPETIGSIGNLAFYANDNDAASQSGANPARNFICRSTVLPTLGTTSFGPTLSIADAESGKESKVSNTTIHILKKATGVADYEDKTKAGVKIAYLTQNISVSIEGAANGTVSASGEGFVSESANIIEAYEGESVTFTFAPVNGYHALAAFDDKPLQPVTELTLDAVTQYEHTLRVVFTDATVWSPVGSSTDWTEPNNWTPKSAPGSTSNVIIPKSSSYPILQGSPECNSLQLEFGAEIGNQHLLAVTTNVDVTCKLEKDRWYLLSVPLDDVLTDDFYFGGTPVSHIKEFKPMEVEEGVYYANWESLPSRSTPFNAGEAFAFGVTGTVNSGSMHEFTISGQLAKGTNEDGIITETLSFGEDDKYGNNPFALAGNPYMATIDFEALAGDDGTVISKNYLLINGDGTIVGRTPVGIHGALKTDNIDVDNDLTQYIAPLQSFIVEKSNKNTTDINTITFTPSIQTTNNSSGTGLRAAEATDHKLNIVADNGVGSILTFIAKRESGQSARKLMSNSSMPDIYTTDGTTAFGAQLINTNDISVPLGISTSYSGEMTLTFSGMDGFSNTVIKLIDNEAEGGKKEIELVGDTYAYPFTHAPKNNNEPTEDRFIIAFSPTNISGTSDLYEEKISVQSKDCVIYAVTSSTNLIRQIFVYDTQGRLIHANNNVHAPDYATGNLPASSTGIYLVKIITERNVKNMKIINK